MAHQREKVRIYQRHQDGIHYYIKTIVQFFHQHLRGEIWKLNYIALVTLQLSNDEELRKLVDNLFPEKVNIIIIVHEYFTSNNYNFC